MMPAVLPRLARRSLGALVLLTGVITPLPGQSSLDRPLRVYLDCSEFRCDTDFYVEEVSWVDFVRDRQSADVHVLATRERTGGGGGSYVLEFRGRAGLEGQRITMQASTEPDATEDEVRSTLVEVVRRGLAPFAASTSAAPRVEVLPPEPRAEDADLTAADDPWDRWSFRIGVNGHMSGESQQRSVNTSSNVSAARVTEAWKIQARFAGSLSENEFQLTDTTTFTSTRESYSGEALVVRSLGPHWSVGGFASWRRSTFANYDHSVLVAPAVEYNLFPYSESNRRILTLLYGIGPRYNDYDQVTLFGQTEETLIEQNLIVGYDVTQPWGSVDVSVHGTHYLGVIGGNVSWPDPQYNVNVFGGFDVRVFKGLSLRLHGGVTMVRGQIHLAAAGLSDEEILTRQRELATDYRYFFSFGLGYRFGSIFTNVVNPRFDEVL